MFYEAEFSLTVNKLDVRFNSNLYFPLFECAIAVTIVTIVLFDQPVSFLSVLVSARFLKFSSMISISYFRSSLAAFLHMQIAAREKGRLIRNRF